MSGFAFHLTCGHCGLASETYPWRYDRVVEPSTLELPAANHARHAFTRVSHPVEHALGDRELAELAAGQSNADVTVYVPHFAGEHGVELRPEPRCPRCGHGTIVARFGQRALVPRIVVYLDEAIDASRALADEAVFSLRLDAPAVGLRCQRTSDAGRPVFAWAVDRIGDSDVSPVVDELVAKLEALGSTCEPPKRFRGFTRFREWPR